MTTAPVLVRVEFILIRGCQKWRSLIQLEVEDA